VERAVAIETQADRLVWWLDATWQVIENILASWTVTDLAHSYQHTWNGEIYAPTRQWTLWRIMSHDIHHGGELSLMLGMQGIEPFELSMLFGHVIMPPLASDQAAMASPGQAV
jgi:uncharacterized damage-inducible protein DinB